MRDILFLSHRIPFPPDKGDKIRSWHILAHLAERYRVHLGCFIDDRDDAAHIPTLQRVCASSRFVELRRVPARIRSIRALATNQPLTFAHFWSEELCAWVAAMHRGRDIAAQYVFSSAMVPYAAAAPGFAGCRIVDFVDVDSEKWAEYARTRRWPLSWIYAREARLLADAEHWSAKNADVSLFVSDAEAALFRRRVGGPSVVQSMPNGVDTWYFDPTPGRPDPYPPGGPVIVFAGRMDYWPNIDAAAWFVGEVMPILRRSMPKARLVIVGAAPTRRVQALANGDAIRVTGRVPDVRPYLAHAAIVVAPLRIARGMQNKVLEAMAMAKAVVATPQAFEGIDATPGKDIIIADGADAFAAELTVLLRDIAARHRIGRSARARAVTTYRWDSRLALLDRLFASMADRPVLRSVGSG